MRTIQTDFLLTGGYGANLGDDAMLISILIELKNSYSNKSVVVFCYNKKNIPIEAKSGFDNVTYFDQSDRINVIAKCRIYGGGNQHFIFEKKNRKLDELKRKIGHQLNNIRELLFTFKKRFGNANFSYQKTVYLGIGLGPFKSKPDLSYLKNSLVILREKLSLTYHENAILGSDPCFNPDFVKILNQKNKKLVNSSLKPKIGIVVRDWYHDFDENRKIFQSIQKYIDVLSPYYHITIINFCKVLDFQYRSLIRNYDDEIIYDSRNNHFYEFINELNSMNLIITMRYHGLVFASILNIPSIGINIDPKIEQFTKEFKSSYLNKIDVGTEEVNVLKMINSILKEYSSNNNNLGAVDFFEDRYRFMMNRLFAYTNSND